MINVSNGRVSQWLTAGQIDGAAIVGTGQRALLDADLALAQLNLRLNTEQRYGVNGLSTNLDGETERQRWHSGPAQAADTPAPGEGGNAQAEKALTAPRVIPTGEFTGTVEEQLKAEKLKQQIFLTGSNSRTGPDNRCQ
jgi:hypothetical protein